jgi:F5/8 type C domain-containing protein
MHNRPTRRQFLATAGGAAVASALLSNTAARAGTDSPSLLLSGKPAADDEVAAIYNHALLLHTNWAEQQWDASAGYFSAANDYFAVVLGNAVLLTHGDYDASVAGVSADTLHEQTVATIKAFAANNVLTGGSVWGETMYFDSTFELYFGLAARLLWDDLDSATQANVAQIMTGQANYALSIGTGNDPRSSGWTTNGLAGGYLGDTKIDEMAVPAQCLGPAVAWYPDDANAATWEHWLNLWLLNDTGLPTADQANPFLVDGVPISQWNTAHNIYDTFFVENHGSFEPCYQEETWRMSARVAAHFMLAGRPVPPAATAKPSGRQLWATMMQVMSNSGEPFMPMIDDRYHLFGRDVIPLAFLAQILGNRYAARAEAMLAGQLVPYLLYPPEYRLTKFSGQPSYEPEARAELGICYLFHLWRSRLGPPVVPVSEEEFFATASGATDYGPDPGLLAQCTPAAFAATVTKPGFVKCVYVPDHDDWLFNVSGATPFLMPSITVTVDNRSAVAYNALRDGFDGTAALLTLLTLTGSFTFPAVTARYVRMQGAAPATQYGYSIFEFSVYGPGSTTDLALGQPTTASSYDAGDQNEGGPFPPQYATDGNLSTRWAVAVAQRSNPASWLEVDLGAPVQVAGVTIAWEAAYGKAYDIQVSLDGTTWTNVATVPGPSGYDGYGYAGFATLPTGTAVYATSGTGVGEGTISVFNMDMPGVPGLNGQRTYTGADGTVTIESGDAGQHTFQGNWLNVDGRAGFVVSGSTNPITVGATQVSLSDGPPSGSAGMVIEAYAAHSPAGTKAAAARSRPSGGPAGLAASGADGYLSLFNLSGAAIGPDSVTVPQGSQVLLYRGTQTTVNGGTAYEVSLPAATAAVEPPRFALASQSPLPAGLQIIVADSLHISISAPAGSPVVHATVTSRATGEQQPVTVKPGQTVQLMFREGRLTPSANLALDRTTYPTSPLPATMSDPALAVDGNPATAWRPGPGGRMVVDLGSQLGLGTLELTWTAGRVPSAAISVSADGLTYTGTGSTPGGPGQQHVTLGTSARYVGVSVPNWSAGDASLTEISVLPSA